MHGHTSVADSVLIRSAKLMQDSRTELRGTIASVFQEAEATATECASQVCCG